MCIRDSSLAGLVTLVETCTEAELDEALLALREAKAESKAK